MAKIGQLNCNTTRQNTGWGSCAWEPGLIVGAIAVPKGFKIVNADITDPAAWIDELIHNDNPNLRGYPFPMAVGLTPTITEAQRESFDYGGGERSGKDFVEWMIKSRKGKMCAFKNMLTYDGGQEQNDWIFFDSKGKVLVWATDVTTAYAFSMMDVYVKSWSPPTQSTNIDYTVNYAFEDADQLNVNLTAIETGLSYSSLQAIQTVNVNQISSTTGGVIKVELLESCGGKNLGETYGSTLAVVGAFRAYSTVNGNAITISTVVYNSILGQYTLDLDTADPDWNVVVDGIRITLAPPNTLNTSYSVAWFEGDNLITTGVA